MNKLKTILKRLHYEENIDVKHHEELINDNHVHIIYLSTLTSADMIVKLIDSLSLVVIKDGSINNLATNNLQKVDKIKDILLSIFEGNALIYFENVDCYLLGDVKKYPSRSISSPEVERSVRGSKDGFNESIADNIALIRRRIKDERLMIKSFVVSSDSKMLVTMMYMNDYCPKEIIDQLSLKIKNVKLQSLIMSESALKETIFKQQKLLTPLVRYTERPDVASINLINGKCILLVDTSPNAIICPTSIMDHLKNVEEYKQNAAVGTFTKILRILGSLISIFLVPLFIVMTLKDNYQNEIIEAVNYNASSPILFQVVAITIFIEIIKIAVVHTPNALISAISLLAAIILGDVSTELGIFSPEILLTCSLSAICNYAIPSYELSLNCRIVSLFMVIMTCILGSSGFLISILVVFLYYVSISTLGLPFLYPLCPFDLKIKNIFVRPEKNNKK